MSLLLATLCVANPIAENLSVCRVEDGQILPSGVSDGEGGLFVIWEDYRTGVDWDVYAQRLGTLGGALWEGSGVPICQEVDNQRYLRLVETGGQAVVAWTDRRSRRGWDVYAQAVDLSGKLLWKKEGVPVCVNSADQSTIAMIGDGVGGVIIVWEDERRSSEFQDLYMQRLDSQGQPVFEPDGIPVYPSETLQSNAQLVSDGVGGFYIVWWDVIGYDQWHIMAYRLDMNGKNLWKAPIPVSPADGLQGEPIAISDGDGGLIVVWQDYTDFVNDGFFAQRLDATGRKLWTEKGVVVCDAEGIQKHASVTSDGAGGFIGVWRDERDVYSDLYAQRIRADGTTAWSVDGVPICLAEGHQDKPSITYRGDGIFFVAWQDYREDYGTESADAIYAQQLNLEGKTLWEKNGLPICIAAGEQSPPYVTPLDGGQLAVLWSDGRTDLGDIYAQFVR